MTQEENFTMLELKVEGIEKKIDDQSEVLMDMSGKLDSITIGLYGDDKNKMRGLIDRVNYLEGKVEGFEKKLEQEKVVKQLEQQSKHVEDSTKSTMWTKAIEILKWAGLAFLLLRGFISIDDLVKIFI